MQAEPGQVAVESLAVVGRGEVAVLEAPVGDGPRDPVDQLPDAVFAFGGAVFAIEVLADDDVGRQLAPIGRNFAVFLLEEDFAPFAFDAGGSQFPLDGLERIIDVGRAESLIDIQAIFAH